MLDVVLKIRNTPHITIYCTYAAQLENMIWPSSVNWHVTCLYGGAERKLDHLYLKGRAMKIMFLMNLASQHSFLLKMRYNSWLKTRNYSFVFTRVMFSIKAMHSSYGILLIFQTIPINIVCFNSL